ncbi:MAG: hypothetical protein V4850_30365 [Myxococcota bacterium]
MRELRGADTGQYLLFTVDTPLVWNGRPAPHVILGGRLVGQPVERGGREFVINLAVVTDPAVATADAFRFDQAEYADIGRATNLTR